MHCSIIKSVHKTVHQSDWLSMIQLPAAAFSHRTLHIAHIAKTALNESIFC